MTTTTASTAETRPDFPEKFWATKQKLIDLKRLGDVPFPLEQVRDRMLIAEAFFRFAMAHDENRVDVILSCMADDVRFEGSLGTVVPFNGYPNKTELAERLSTAVGEMVGQRRHVISNVLIESLTESTATAYAYGVVTRADQGLYLQATVIYVGELRKEADGFWRFTRFFIGMDEYVDDGADIPRPQ